MKLSCVLTDPSDDAALREKEVALVQLGELYRDQGCASSSTIGMDGHTDTVCASTGTLKHSQILSAHPDLS